MKKQRKAFTLIELLVVISIIALLMSIMMPALGQTKRIAQATVCFSNLRHWGVIWRMFADDREDKFTDDLDWVVPLWPYYKDDKILLCPAAKKRGRRVDCRDNILGSKYEAWVAMIQFVDDEPEEEVYGSYGLNYWANDSGAAGSNWIKSNYLWHSPTLKGTFQAPLLCDSVNIGFAPLPTDTPPTYDDEPYWGCTNRDEIRASCINRHPNGTINVLFCDFAARKVGLKQLWDLKWYRNWPWDSKGQPVPPPNWSDPKFRWMSKFSHQPIAF